MKISVYITSYNQKEFLKEAIESVLAQTLLPFEILIVDDASKDGSKDLIESYCLQYPNLIKSHYNLVNRGITYCRNKALTLVKGDYITWLDGDDIYLPKKLETQVNLIKSSGANLVYTNYYYSKEDISNIYQIWCSDIDELPKTKHIFKEVISRKFPRHNLFRYELVEAKLLERVNGYDENLKIYEDFDFRIRICEKANTFFTLEPLSVYRIHGKGLSNADNKIHLNSLNYIFNKYKKEISNLSNQDTEEVNRFINFNLSRFIESTQEKTTIKTKIKRKLKYLINKL